jgi:hypothetical protein
MEVQAAGFLARLTGIVGINDKMEACRRIFARRARWTVVRGSDLEEGVSQGSRRRRNNLGFS